jgi:anti-sigma regulatory factor (Ser/Thr protein kinase)
MEVGNRPASEPLRLDLPVDSDSVAAARPWAGDYADRVGAPREDVELAISEAVTNCVVHAYPEADPSGTITLRAEVSGSTLLLAVTDDGVGMRPNPNGTGLGFGLPLIASVTEQYGVEEATRGGSVVTMRFRRGEVR